MSLPTKGIHPILSKQLKGKLLNIKFFFKSLGNSLSSGPMKPL